jgi:hypothetical protein
MLGTDLDELEQPGVNELVELAGSAHPIVGQEQQGLGDGPGRQGGLAAVLVDAGEHDNVELAGVATCPQGGGAQLDVAGFG